MLKHWKVLLLIVVVLASLLSIGYKTYPHGRDGVQIIYITENSPAYKILEPGDVITSVNNVNIKKLEDWNAAIQGQNSFHLIINGEEQSFVVNNTNQTLGIHVSEIDRTNLDFGLDIKGGTRVILKPDLPKENLTSLLMEQIIGTLQTRANLFGLREISIKELSDLEGSRFVQIEASGLGSEIVNTLLTRTGSFKGKITKPAYIQNNKAILILGDKPEDKHELPIENQTLLVNNQKIKINDTFEYDEIKFQYLIYQQDQILLLAEVYEGDDVQQIFADAQSSGIAKTDPEIGDPEGYNFFFTVLISADGAERFRKVTSGIPSTGRYLTNSEIFLYLDGNLITQLNIASSLGGQAYTTPQIQGFRETRDGAREETVLIQSVLKSGEIPAKLEVVSTDIISPTLGASFLQSIGFVALLGILSVFIAVFVRYRKIKIALPMVFVSLSEVLIILGVAAINDGLVWGLVFLINLILLVLAWWKKQEVDIFALLGALSIPILGFYMNWTIDLPSIGGIIAAIGTGIDHQIIIADETLSKRIKRLFTVKEKIKVAFFIIFGAAATTIVAMLPLIFLVAEFVRGFAITTIIGLWIGITITRPAYAKIVESLVKEKDLFENKEEKQKHSKEEKEIKTEHKASEENLLGKGSSKNEEQQNTTPTP